MWNQAIVALLDLLKRKHLKLFYGLPENKKNGHTLKGVCFEDQVTIWLLPRYKIEDSLLTIQYFENQIKRKYIEFNGNYFYDTRL